MTDDFTAHCDEQIAIVDTLIENLTTERTGLVKQQAAFTLADMRRELQRIEWRLMVLDQEVTHLTFRRNYWEAARLRGFATIPVVGHGYRRGSPI